MTDIADGKTAAPPKLKRQRLTTDEKIARLQQQMQRLKVQKQKRSRQLETREKIIVGAAVLNAMRDDAEWKTRVAALLNDKVSRDIDREVIAPWLSGISTSR